MARPRGELAGVEHDVAAGAGATTTPSPRPAAMLSARRRGRRPPAKSTPGSESRTENERSESSRRAGRLPAARRGLARTQKRSSISTCLRASVAGRAGGGGGGGGTVGASVESSSISAPAPPALGRRRAPEQAGSVPSSASAHPERHRMEVSRREVGRRVAGTGGPTPRRVRVRLAIRPRTSRPRGTRTAHVARRVRVAGLGGSVSVRYGERGRRRRRRRRRAAVSARRAASGSGPAAGSSLRSTASRGDTRVRPRPHDEAGRDATTTARRSMAS